jgi:1,2-diacylglycerol 3-beta-galactosyltransferase
VEAARILSWYAEIVYGNVTELKKIYERLEEIPLQRRHSIDFRFLTPCRGHRAAATALQQVIATQNRPWEVELVDVQDVLDELDVFRKLTGLRLEDIYNQLLARGWTLGSTQLLPLMHGVIRVYHRAQVRVLTRFWRERRPDLVVSLIPNFNRALFEALRRRRPGRPTSRS